MVAAFSEETRFGGARCRGAQVEKKGSLVRTGAILTFFDQPLLLHACRHNVHISARDG